MEFTIWKTQAAKPSLQYHLMRSGPIGGVLSARIATKRGASIASSANPYLEVNAMLFHPPKERDS